MLHSVNCVNHPSPRDGKDHNYGVAPPRCALNLLKHSMNYLAPSPGLSDLAPIGARWKLRAIVYIYELFESG